MRIRRHGSLLRFGSLLAFVLALGACTKGGQFDPTTMLDNDMFDSKKPLKGDRESLFPQGVPGAQTGIPKELYKGYQPPPEQQAADNAAVVPAPPAPEPPKPKPKPKPRVATTTPPTARTEISVGLKPKPAQQPQSAQSSQSPWPNPSPPPAAQTAWPAAPSAPPAQGSQSPWPAPPQTSQAQQTAQPSQSIWPNPPATSSH
jgi:hypothetical protein